MKSKDTLKWFPAQLPEVRIILGDAVVEVAKQGRPINTRTLLEKKTMYYPLPKPHTRTQLSIQH